MVDQDIATSDVFESSPKIVQESEERERELSPQFSRSDPCLVKAKVKGGAKTSLGVTHDPSAAALSCSRRTPDFPGLLL